MKEIIINSDKQKSNIVVLDDGKVVEHYKELYDNKTIEGNIYAGKVVSVLPGMQAAFVDIGEEKKAFLHIKDVIPKVSNITGNKNEKLSDSDIKKYVKVGMPILVQVKKDKVETKGARISTDINIPGKYIALIPNSEFITVSNKIEDCMEINRLKEIVRNNITSGFGVVIRTAANGKAEDDLAKEIKKLEKIYKDIKDKFEAVKDDCPQKIYEIGGIINKILLALVEDVEKVSVNNREIYNFMSNEYPDFRSIFEYTEKVNIFSADTISQIEKLENRKIWLNCGGFITIDRTEALTAIDVNTGKYIGNNSLEETVLKVNEEATVEIAKQLRARDIGGIIIVDYIDMEEKENEKKIIELLNKCLKCDRAKTQVIGFTPLHLLEMTRKHLYSN
ncbi:MAG: Rne/Rng family ribonuclease [Clostridia bacterium]|nr:Rne/Rng family ribonuclease [Clostridia bacterium]